MSSNSWLAPGSILPEDVELAHKIIRDWQWSKSDKFRLIFLSQPATFLEEDFVPQRLREVWFRGVIQIALVAGARSGVGGKIHGAIVRADGNLSIGVTELLLSFGVKVYSGDLTDVTSLGSFLDGAMTPVDRRERFRPVVNHSERWLKTLVKESLAIDLSSDLRKAIQNVDPTLLDEFRELQSEAKTKFRVFQEIAASQLVVMEQNVEPTKDQQKILDRLATFRCDLVVVAAPPTRKPLLVAEFDGPKHLESEKAKKDRWRDNLLVGAGIVVVRISFESPGSGVGKLDIRPIEYKLTDVFCRHVLGNLCRIVYDYQFRARTADKGDLELLRAIFHRKLHRDYLRSSRTPSSTEVSLLWSRFVAEPPDEFLEKQSERMIEQEESERFYEEMLDEKSIEHKTLGKFCLSQVEYDPAGGGIAALGTIEDQQGRKYPINTPRFFLKIKAPKELRGTVSVLSRLKRDAAKAALLELANERIRLLIRNEHD